MSDTKKPAGTISWVDISVPNAENLREFYAHVVGWTAEPVDMGGYDDYSMNPPDGSEAVAGICHAKGPNADLPAQWLMYVAVDDLEQSITRCTELGGKVLVGPRSMGADCRFSVIQDPAGAVMAIHESTK